MKPSSLIVAFALALLTGACTHHTSPDSAPIPRGCCDDGQISLSVAEAFHQALFDEGREYNIEVCYKGCLSRRHLRGLRPAFRQAVWTIVTPEGEITRGAEASLRKYLFSMELVKGRNESATASLQTQDGQTYGIVIEDPDDWNTVYLQKCQIDPVEFVSRVCKRLSSDH